MKEKEKEKEEMKEKANDKLIGQNVYELSVNPALFFFSMSAKSSMAL